MLHSLFRQYVIIGLLWIGWLVANMQFTTKLPPLMSTGLLTQGHSSGDNMLICFIVFALSHDTFTLQHCHSEEIGHKKSNLEAGQ